MIKRFVICHFSDIWYLNFELDFSSFVTEGRESVPSKIDLARLVPHQRVIELQKIFLVDQTLF